MSEAWEEAAGDGEPLYRMNMEMATMVYGLLFSLPKAVDSIEKMELPADIRVKYMSGHQVAEHLRADLREWLANEMGEAELADMENQLRKDARKIGLNL